LLVGRLLLLARAISLRAVLVTLLLLRLGLPLGIRLLLVRLRSVLGLPVPLGLLLSLLVVLWLRIARSGNPHQEKQNCRAGNSS
jgi:hypothetical protein